MSRLDELIRQYCPDGVEYRTLGDVATQWYRGAGIKRDEVSEKGIPCIRYGEIHTTYHIWFDKCVSHTDEQKQPTRKYADYGDILFAITSEDVPFVGNSVAYLGEERILVGGDIVVMKHNQNPKYMAYALLTTDAVKQKGKGKVKSKVVHTSVPSLQGIEIPVPPLPVQEEIVRILDTFTELQAELQAELQKRKQQYGYYLDNLLAFNKLPGGAPEVKWMKLSEVASFSYGYTTKAEDSGDVRYIRITDITDRGQLNSENGKYISLAEDATPYLLKKGDLIMARTGATFGKTLYYDEDYPAVYASFLIKIVLNQLVDSRYYWHFTRSSMYWEQAHRLVGGGAQPQFNTGAISQVKIPVPPLAEQRRVADILDRFDALTNDLSSGLPAEMEKRRRQYEHYRDKLLTFRRKGN